MFLEKRVYQGSSGGVPYGVIDTLTGERELRDYHAVWMENDFIRIMLSGARRTYPSCLR
jgi:hypothetical protein